MTKHVPTLIAVALLLAAGPAAAQFGATRPPPGATPVGGGPRIADNESPRPQDRFYFGYNYYNNVFVRAGASISAPDNLRSGNFFGAPESVAPDSSTGFMLEAGARIPIAFGAGSVDDIVPANVRRPYMSFTGSAVVRNNELNFRSPFGEHVRSNLTQIQFLAGLEIQPLVLTSGQPGFNLGGTYITPVFGAQVGVGLNLVNDLSYYTPGPGLTARQDGALRVAPVAAVSAGLRISLENVHPGLQGEIGYRFSYNGGIRSGGSFNFIGGGPIAVDPFRGTSYSHDIYVGLSLPFSVPPAASASPP